MRDLPKQDPNYNVDGLPPSIKGKITSALKAAQDYAFLGAAPPEDHDAVVENLQVARYDLERTIMTHLERAAK